jgi:membrane protease YdiL (CAAX protease family)
LLPYVLILNHAIVFVVLLAVMRADALSQRSIDLTLEPGSYLWREVGLGLVAGLALYSIGYFLLTPLSELLQRKLGGYRTDKGDRDRAYRLAWLIAVVIFASVVEEFVYRGYALAQLAPLTGTAWAVIISSVFFGLLHWAYGWWGMASSVVYGVIFALLFLWRENLVAPIIAHALHNLINTLMKQNARR